ncbi:MAG: hypothetical protein ACE5KA_08580 [Nitrososphaerales archaeon]
MIQYKRYIAICSGILLLLPVIANAERLFSFDQMYLSISTDKRVYYAGDTAVYKITFKDSQGRPLDPDIIRATYNSQFIQLERISDGIYIYVTGKLTLRNHQLGIYGERDGFNFVQQSSTIRPVVTQKISDEVKATAVQQGDLLKFRLSNDMLSKKEIFKVRVIIVGASVDSITSASWIKVQNHMGIDLKSINGSIAPDERQTIKLIINGKASMVVWNAYDLHGKQINAGANKVVS